MEHLSSLKNPRVMLWRSLRDRKERLKNGLFLVEGRKMTEEALRSDMTVETILADEERLDTLTLPDNVEIVALPSHVFAAVCDTKTPQGIAAVVRLPQGEQPVHGSRLLAMDGVQDPGNVGTIIRTADAAGFDGVILSRECADVYSPKVLRATMGSVFHIGITVTDELPSALHRLAEAGYSILSSQLDGEPFYSRRAVGKRYCLIIGNEGNGVSPQVQQEATHRLRLPMRGEAESLNAAIAAGIMMYDLVRADEEQG